jgi:hypothetical protein
MLYRLAFNITDDGYLRVTAAAKDLPLVSAIHLNDEVFAAAIKLAKMAPFQTIRILEAAREARRHPTVEICCEAIELTQAEVDAMYLRRDELA